MHNCKIFFRLRYCFLNWHFQSSTMNFSVKVYWGKRENSLLKMHNSRNFRYFFNRRIRVQPWTFLLKCIGVFYTFHNYVLFHTIFYHLLLMYNTYIYFFQLIYNNIDAFIYLLHVHMYLHTIFIFFINYIHCECLLNLCFYLLYYFSIMYYAAMHHTYRRELTYFSAFLPCECQLCLSPRGGTLEPCGCPL